MKKITLLICLIIILNAPISAYAQATATTPTVTIAAGSGAAVGGVYNQNGSKTAMAATALTLAVLSATGATVKLTEASIQAGKTVYQVINDKFAQWVGGTSAEDLTPTEAAELQSRFKVITGGGGDPEDPDNNQNNGTNVSDDGKLWFSPGSLSMLKKFTDWLESNDQLNNYEASNNDNATVDLGSLGQFDLLTTLYKPDSYRSYTYNASSPCIFYKYIHSTLVIISNSAITLKRVSTINSTSEFEEEVDLIMTEYNGYYYYTATFRSSLTTDPTIEDSAYNAENFINSITEWNVQGAETQIENDGIYKGENYNPSILDNPNNQSLVIDPGILPYINPTTDQQINIPDYLQLLIDQAQANATDQNQPINVPSIDPATLEEQTVEVPVIRSDPITEPAPSEPADPIATPDNPVQNPEELPSPEEAVELMKVDLTRIFPFCIPWDLYRLIAKFNAEPVTPSLTIDWGNILGSIGIDYETTIDLHDYDGVAQVLRTMETVAFVIGLAVATRSIFLQS